MSLKEYYSNLLIVQYHDKTKAKATIELITNVLLPKNSDTDNYLASDIKDAFNLETAVGDQLDILDNYIGVGRGYEGTNLSDSDFRFLMKLRIVQNNSSHSFKDINDSLYDFFGTEVYMVSDGDMKMTYYVPATLSTIINAIIDKEILPRPMGVKIDVILSVPASGNYFGFKKYTASVIPDAGFTDYSDIEKDGAFLTYDDIIA